AARVTTPFIIFHGDADNTVRPAQSASFKEVLDRNRVANARHVFEGIGHPVDREKAEEVYGLMRRWFETHGGLAAAPGTPAASAPSPAAPPPSPARPPADAPPQWVREKIEARNSRFETFTSATIGRDVSYVIYRPAAYDRSPEARYPVMYWLHG